jgi:hypothetical protein
MGKYLALALVIPLLFSCAARKVAVTKIQTETHTDSVVVEKKDSVSIKQNAIVITDSSDEIEVTPIDTAKPVIIGDTKYYNAKVKVRKNKIKLVDSSKTVTIQSTDKQIQVQKDIKSKVFDKKVDKKTNYILFFWLIVVLLMLWLARKYLPK